MDFTNPDFINMMNDLEAMDRALDNTSEQSTSHPNEHPSNVLTVEEAESKFIEHLVKSCNNPFTKPAPHNIEFPPGTGRPFRKLYAELEKFLEQENADDTEVEKAMEAFCAAVDPNHPFLSRKKEFDNSESLEGARRLAEAITAHASKKEADMNSDGDDALQPEQSTAPADEKVNAAGKGNDK